MLEVECLSNSWVTNIGVARIFNWGGGQTAKHMQRRHQKFSKKDTFHGKKYCRMGGSEARAWFDM